MGSRNKNLYLIIGIVIVIVVVYMVCKRSGHMSEHFLVKNSFPTGGYYDWGMYPSSGGNPDDNYYGEDYDNAPLGTRYISGNPDALNYPYGENQDQSREGQGITYTVNGPELWF